MAADVTGAAGDENAVASRLSTHELCPLYALVGTDAI
jgi:hypothetical protein